MNPFRSVSIRSVSIRAVPIRAVSMYGALLAVAVPVLSHADVYVSQVPLDGSAPSILVFASDAIGDAAPIRTITGPNTLLNAPFAITVDPVNSELYVSDFFGSAVRVYALDADGDAAPLRNLVDGDNSQLAWPRQLVVDTVNDEIVVPSFNIFDPPPAPFSSLRVYPRTADGDVAPVRSIFGDSTNLDNPINIVLDGAHNELITNSYIANGSSAGIVTFPRDGDGDIAPLRAIAGAQTQFPGYTNFLSFDPGADELYADANPGYVVFPRTADGNVAPARSVTGIETGIDSLTGLTYDTVNDRVIVLSYDEDDPAIPRSLIVFDRAADGDAVPLLTISGPHTQLVAPVSVAVDDGGGFSGIGAQVYRVEIHFYDVIGSQTLAIEDFEGGSAESGDVIVCDEPVDSNSNDDCFTPDTLIGGFDVTSSSGAGVAAVGSDFFGNASTAVGAVFIGDSTIIRFAGATTTFAMDVFLYNGGDGGRINIALYGANDEPIGFSNVQPASGSTQAFLGVIAPVPVARVELTATTGGAFIDNLRFNAGDEIFADGFDGQSL